MYKDLEKRRECKRRWYENNKDKVKVASLRWLSKHPGYQAERSKLRRAKRRIEREKLKLERQIEIQRKRNELAKLFKGGSDENLCRNEG